MSLDPKVVTFSLASSMEYCRVIVAFFLMYFYIDSVKSHLRSIEYYFDTYIQVRGLFWNRKYVEFPSYIFGVIWVLNISPDHTDL